MQNTKQFTTYNNNIQRQQQFTRKKILEYG